MSACALVHCWKVRGCLSGDLLHGVDDGGVVEFALAEEAEEGVDDVGGCVGFHGGACLVVVERLVVERTLQDPCERRHLLAGGERLGSAE